MPGALDAKAGHLALAHPREGPQPADGQQLLGDLAGHTSKGPGRWLRGKGRLAGGGDWRRMIRRDLVNDRRSGSTSTARAAWCSRRRMAWWTSSMPQSSWVTMSGERERSTTPGPRWWVLSSSRAVSNSHRWWYLAASSAAGALWDPGARSAAGRGGLGRPAAIGAQGVVDPPHGDRVAAVPVVAGGDDLAELGAIGQGLGHGQDRVALGAPHQRRAGRGRLAPQPKAGKAAVGQQESPGPSTPNTWGARVTSPLVNGPMVAWMIAWVPHSATASRRTCGKAACSPRRLGGRPNAAALAGDESSLEPQRA
jgi:hypothetical protein